MSDIIRVTVCQLDTRDGFRAAAFDALAVHVTESQPTVLLLPELPFSPWLAGDREIDPRRWQRSVKQHDSAIAELGRLRTDAVVASRSTPNRKNQAFTWSRVTGPLRTRDKYYLPDEEGYWEASWYDRGEQRFPSARVGKARAWESLSAPKCGSWNGRATTPAAASRCCVFHE
ncbi:hypothetical protein [Actinoplanes sp. N902-109]|uniref:hypothetical protein n=1 Tax=Actinoplanes sp. (strain N902-109) TaxID=649831 RepID=UPI0012FA25AF|nr:hypothetical protein [Actinoplanes sp. N902-109]